MEIDIGMSAAQRAAIADGLAQQKKAWMLRSLIETL